MNELFSELPLFATDKELAIAIVGPKRATEWLRDKFPTISVKQGFPPVDSFHGGRPTVKVAKFYETYIGMTGPNVNFAPDGGDSVLSWGKRRTEKNSQAKANSDAWADKKRKALEEHRAKRAAAASTEADKTD